MKASHTIRPVFDDPNLVSAAGLVPAMLLAESAGLHAGLEERLSVNSPNPVAKSACLIAAMLAGADSIDDTNLLRHGAMDRLFTGIRAPSTLGTYLRSFTFGHVQQLDAVGAQVLAGLAARVPALLNGTHARARETGVEDGGSDDVDSEPLVFLDIDDTIREVHGYQKQAAAYGYTRVRGLNAQIVTLSSTQAPPVIARGRLRRGNVRSLTGAPRLLAQAFSTATAAGVNAQILTRADSGYYSYTFIATVLRHQAWFSVTAPRNPGIKTAIASIPEEAWQAISYPNAVYDEEENTWISDAEVAEVTYTAFMKRRKAERVRCRLVVRRVKRLQPLASDGTEQGELFATYRHHAFITNSTLPLLEADQRHREHAIVEQVIAELKAGPLAHLPSGSYAANAAWLSHAIIAFNLARAIDATTPGHHRMATLRTRLINVPARVATSGRRLTLHLPTNWAWAQAWTTVHATATGPPTPATP